MHYRFLSSTGNESLSGRRAQPNVARISKTCSQVFVTKSLQWMSMMKVQKAAQVELFKKVCGWEPWRLASRHQWCYLILWKKNHGVALMDKRLKGETPIVSPSRLDKNIRYGHWDHTCFSLNGFNSHEIAWSQHGISFPSSQFLEAKSIYIYIIYIYIYIYIYKYVCVVVCFYVCMYAYFESSELYNCAFRFASYSIFLRWEKH